MILMLSKVYTSTYVEWKVLDRKTRPTCFELHKPHDQTLSAIIICYAVYNCYNCFYNYTL